MTARTGSVTEALAQGRRLLAGDPARAAEQARAILASIPDLAQAKLLLAQALRRQGRMDVALPLLESLSVTQPRAPHIRLELGLAHYQRGDFPKALAAFEQAVARDPDLGEAWGMLVVLYVLAGRAPESAAAGLQQLRAANPGWQTAIDARIAGRPAEAEAALRPAADQDEIPALRLLAETLMRQNRAAEAEAVLRRCVELAPGFSLARFALVLLLDRLGQGAAASAQAARLAAAEPDDPGWRALQAMLGAGVPLGEKAR